MKFSILLSRKFACFMLAGITMFTTVSAADDLSFANNSPVAADAQVWGGRGVTMQITANGATLEFDCAQGLIETKIEISKAKRFDVPGKFANEAGGPVPVIGVRDEDGTVRTPAEGIAWQKVRYIARMQGRLMRLTVRDANGVVLGRFRLFRDSPGHLLKCRH